MRNIDRIEVGASQSARLRTCGISEFVRRYRDGRNAKILESRRVVQTARCAGPSIGKGLYYGIASCVDQRLNNLIWSRFRERGLRHAKD